MNDTRLWIVLVAVVSCLAGTALGLWIARSGDAPATSGWAAFGQQFGDDFDLSPERRAALRQFLDQHASDRADVKSRYEARVQAELEPELRALDLRCESYIRDHVLPPSKREQFDQWCRPRQLLAAR